MSRWFRLYADVLDDPKVQRLPPDMFKAWINLLCLASRNEGILPPIDDIAFALRMSQDVTRDMVVTLTKHGLLDDDNGLSPHNWQERQFKSDTPEGARERKRKQRMREKNGKSEENVTECHSDSHVEVTPPEQNRTEQNRTHTEGACDSEEPKHKEEVQGYLDNRSDDLNHWEREFLISIKWFPVLTKTQAEKFDAIRDKLKIIPADKELPSVKRGTPAYDAWISYFKRTGRPTAFYERQDQFTVLSEFPPVEKVA